MGTYSVGGDVDVLIRELRKEMTKVAGWEPTNPQVLRYAVTHTLADIQRDKSKATADKEESNSAR